MRRQINLAIFTVILYSYSSAVSKPAPTPCNRICRYNSHFFNGEVCIGCFRDSHEISNWASMSPTEKGYALEDAIDRYQSQSETSVTFEGSISNDELREQAKAWFAFGRSRVQDITDDDNIDGTNYRNINVKDGSGDTIDALVVSEASDDANNVWRVVDSGPSVNVDATKETSKITPRLLSNVQLPPTPCTRICRYNADFYNGAICIGCFRDSYEISNWSSMSYNEKMYTLEDAAARCEENGAVEEIFEGGISQFELLRQAELWGGMDTVREQATLQPNVEMEKEGWVEINIESNDFTKGEDYNDFIAGESVIMLHPVITKEECREIIEAARKVASEHRSKRLANGLPDEGLVRIPTISAKRRATANNSPCAKAIDISTNEKLADLLVRVCKVLESYHESMIERLFGTRSLHKMLEKDELVFSSREPAINIYTKKGHFRPHEDGQKLTVLIPLSSGDEFTGGGTAFWPQDSRGHRIEPASLELRPNCGTPILFVGHVTHSGLPVKDGERVVFVASFSAK